MPRILRSSEVDKVKKKKKTPADVKDSRQVEIPERREDTDRAVRSQDQKQWEHRPDAIVSAALLMLTEAACKAVVREGKEEPQVGV